MNNRTCASAGTADMSSALPCLAGAVSRTRPWSGVTNALQGVAGGARIQLGTTTWLLHSNTCVTSPACPQLLQGSQGSYMLQGICLIAEITIAAGKHSFAGERHKLGLTAAQQKATDSCLPGIDEAVVFLAAFLCAPAATSDLQCGSCPSGCL
jgi:hypothetical protein